MSRQKRKRRLLEHLASLGYVFRGSLNRKRLHLSNAQRVPLYFELDPLLVPLVTEFARKKWKMTKYEVKTGLVNLQFSTRQGISRWLRITGKILEDELWS